jgi:tetratricopeptide (TPR) repeat protein
VIAGLAIAGVVAMQRSRLNAPPATLADLKQAEQQEAWRLQLLKQSPTFGFDNVVAGWTFLNFLQYYGDTPAREQTGYSLSPEYFDIITRLDPRFVDSYLFLSGSVSYQLGQPERAIAMMQRGSAALSPQVHPRAYLVWRFKGLDYLLLLGDIPAAIRAHEMAAKWAQESPDRDIAPIYQQTADFLRGDPSSRLARFQAWSMVYYQAAASKDKQTQARAQQELVKLGAKMQDSNGRVTFTLPQTPEPTAPKSPQSSPTPPPAAN